MMIDIKKQQQSRPLYLRDNIFQSIKMFLTDILLVVHFSFYKLLLNLYKQKLVHLDKHIQHLF